VDLKERLIQFIEFKGISKRKFCEKINVSHTYINGLKAMGSDVMLKISDVFPELNLIWLITEKGKMLNDPVKIDPTVEAISPVAEEQEKFIRKIVQEELEKKNKRKSNNVAPAGN